MESAWFALYHVYSTSKTFDRRGFKNFENDMRLAQEIGVKILILEDYYSDFIWGEFSNFWNEEMFRKMVQITQAYGIKFIPYLDTTELATHGEVYKRNGRQWSAKNRWGKSFSAFSSIFLPYYPGFDFHTKLMCPASGWSDYLINQAHVLLSDYGVDGIYLDRVDYRVNCYDHSKDKDHFLKELPVLVKGIHDEVKSSSTHNILILNDSCVNPDPPLIDCMKVVDYVLTELLPVDTDPNNFYWQFVVNWGDLIWLFRKLLKPILKLFMNAAFTTGSMTDNSRIQKIIDRLKPYVGKKIIVFSHRKDIEGIKVIREIAQRNRLLCGIVPGLNYLNEISYYLQEKK